MISGSANLFKFFKVYYLVKITKFDESNYFLAASIGSTIYFCIYKLNNTDGRIYKLFDTQLFVN